MMRQRFLEKFLRVMCLSLLMTSGVFQAPAIQAVTASQASESLEEAGVAAVPPGFNRILWGTGVSLYKIDNYKEYGNPAYVQTVALNRGASVQLLHGDITVPGGNGVYGGKNPKILRASLETIWNEQVTPNSFCIFNGAFFDNNRQTMLIDTYLSFPLKKDGVLVSGGAHDDPHDGKILMLELWPNKADIRRLTKEALAASNAPNIVAGLAEDFPKGRLIDGRTFLGIDNADGDASNTYETILIFSSTRARQVADAAQTLRDFGADKVIQLDGGGSTQFKCRNDSYLTGDNRTLPQTILITKGIYEFNSQFTINTAGWNPVNGNWLLSTDGSGLYHTPGLVNLPVSTRHTNTYRNFTYEIKMQRSGCTYCANTLIIRGDPLPLDPGKIWSTGYYFQYTNHGYFSVWKVDNGVHTPLLNWTSSPAIRLENWNALRVTASGNTLKFHINGTLVWSGADSSYQAGAVGISMYKDLLTFGNRLRVDWARLSTPFGVTMDEELVPGTEAGLPGGNMLISP
jgi:hypothetical protein